VCTARSPRRTAQEKVREKPPVPSTLSKYQMRLLRSFLCGPAIAPRCFTHSARILAASLSTIPLKGSYTAITEQLWRQREQAKNRGTFSPPSGKSAAREDLAPKPQCDTVVMYDFPGDPKLKDEYSNPWGDVRCASLHVPSGFR
jgi:hypothetical protein